MKAIDSIKQAPSYPDQSTNILTITREEADRIEQYVEQQNKQNQPTNS